MCCDPLSSSYTSWFAWDVTAWISIFGRAWNTPGRCVHVFKYCFTDKHPTLFGSFHFQVSCTNIPVIPIPCSDTYNKCDAFSNVSPNRPATDCIRGVVYSGGSTPYEASEYSLRARTITVTPYATINTRTNYRNKTCHRIKSSSLWCTQKYIHKKRKRKRKALVRSFKVARMPKDTGWTK